VERPTYQNQTPLETRRLGNVAITAPFLERMKVRQIIDQHLPGDDKLEFSYGQIIELLVAARLSGPTPLSGIQDWAEESGADLLYAIPNEKLNDDRFGRALDQFFTQRHSILGQLALHVCETFGISLNKLHYDPTHLFFTGEYENAQPREQRMSQYDNQGNLISVCCDGDLPAAHITKGKPLADAPIGSRMVHLGIGTFVDELGPVPLSAHMMDGNENGHAGIEEHLGLITKHLQPQTLIKVSDRGTFSVGHLQRIVSQGFDAICSAPWNDVSKLFDEKFESLQWYESSYLSIEQRRRRDRKSTLPLEHYQIASTPYTFKGSASTPSVDTRVIFVYSTADVKAVAKQRAKQLNKIKIALEKCRLNVQRRGAYSDCESVTRRMAKLLAKGQVAKHVTWNMVPLSKEDQTNKAVQGRGNRQPTHQFKYTINETMLEEEAHYDGYSAIVTTLKAQDESDDDVFLDFRQQTYSELANRTLKNPKQLAVRPVFLQTPERVEALAFALVIALMTHYLIQREYRKHATADPDATEKDKTRTADKIFLAFRSYCLVLEKEGRERYIYPTALNERQRNIINRLSIPPPSRFLKNKFAA